MRKGYYILWKDDNIENNENSEYFEELSKRIEVNVYKKTNVNDALDVINTKNYACFKLITNTDDDLSVNELIEKAREITGTNFVCLVFATSLIHIEWISKNRKCSISNKRRIFCFNALICPSYFSSFNRFKP